MEAEVLKTWALPGDGPNNFKVKPKLNKKLNIRFGKEALGRQKRLCTGYDKETGEKLYRPALKLSK